MPLRAEHFTTPIRLVLPGIIVSLIGASAGYYIFNNPDKIRGANSRAAWNNLVKYETIYSENAEVITCEYNGNIGDQYFKDLVHLQEMTVQNLKMLRDDKDIDKLMASIINLRIDTYDQMKNISNKFFDTLAGIEKKMALAYNYDTAYYNSLQNSQTAIQKDFIANRDHIYMRDSSIIKNLGIELKRYYKQFGSVVFNIATPITFESIKGKVTGTWTLLTNGMPLKIKIDSTNKGTWSQEGVTHPFTWKFDDNDLIIHFTDNFDVDTVLILQYCSDRIMQFQFESVPDLVLTACRVKRE